MDKVPEQKLTRITVLTGHYGSGKTEIAMNLAIRSMDAQTHARQEDGPGRYDKVALCDLDIANPYFRSRERTSFLRERGIDIISNTFEQDITEDLPAISPRIKAPLQNKRCRAILDAGGNDTGAMVLSQFKEALLGPDCQVIAVINGNRPETETTGGAIMHLEGILSQTGIPLSGIINNTHLLSETTPGDILAGHALCMEVSRKLGIPLLFDCCVEQLVPQVKKEATNKGRIMEILPLDLYMRPSWMQRY